MNNRVRYINETSSSLDHYIFIITFLVGVSWILLTRLVFDARASVAVIVPVLALFFYASLLLQGSFRLREDRAADNVYYLGFLYTLTALGIGLYRYDASLGGVDNIIRDLGVGLTSTILGLFLRILLLQLRVDPEEAGEDARVELSNAITDFRAHVHEMALITNDAQAATRQQQEDAIKFLAEETDGLKKTIGELSGTVSKFDKKIGSIEIPNDLLTSVFTESNSKVGDAVTELVERINNCEVDFAPVTKEISSAARNMVDEILSLSGRIANMEIDQSHILRQVNTKTEAIAEEFHRISEILYPLSNSISSNTQLYNQSIMQLKELIELLALVTNQQSPVTSAMDALTSSVDKYNQVAEQMAALPESMKSAIENITESDHLIGLSTKELVRRIEDVSNELSTVKSASETLESRLSSVTAQFERTIAALLEAASDKAN